MEQEILSILNKYIIYTSVYPYNWRQIAENVKLLEESASPEKTADDRLDILPEKFKKENREVVLHEENWYVQPLLELAAGTGRETEAHAVIGLKYFDSAFRWKI